LKQFPQIKLTLLHGIAPNFHIFPKLISGLLKQLGHLATNIIIKR